MTWAEALDHYYQTHPTLNDENRLWLRTKVKMDIPLVADMAREQIREIFTVDGRFSHSLLVRTLVWQTLGQLIAGEIEKFNGNVRAFWYAIVDPIYEHNQLYSEVIETTPKFITLVEEFQYRQRSQSLDFAATARKNKVKKKYVVDLSEDSLGEFVEQHIVRYKDQFNLTDGKNGFRLIGEGWASLIFFVEKEGLFADYCDDIHKKYGISVMASRGFPTRIGLESFGDQLRAKKIKNVGLAGVVDYDPSGYLIFDDYRHQFEAAGFGVKNHTRLTSLDLFTEYALDNKYDDLTKVKPNREKLTQKWFEKTGGIHGKRYGIHVNHASKPRVRNAFDQWYQQQVERIKAEGE
ncbi:MAG: hypothetical protein WBO35_01120 [Candidatus Saccharimonadales bacterium]